VARLSIVIPVLGGLEGLEDTLVSVLENRPADCQVVVVHNRPYDDPYDLKSEVCFVEAPRRSRLATTLNLGVAASDAPIVHAVACGVEVSPGWTDAVLPLFDDPDVGAVAPLVLDKCDPQRVVTAGVDYRADGALRSLSQGKLLVAAARRNAEPCGPDVLAGFYRTSALEAAGGFSDAVAEPLTTIDAALSMRRIGFRCARQTQCWTFADPSAQKRLGALRRGIAAERFFWRWAPAAGWTRSLLGHLLYAVGQGVQCPLRPSRIVEMAGRMLGAASIPAHRRHWRLLREAARTSATEAPRVQTPTGTHPSAKAGIHVG
jgi:hypothetical protein